MHTPAHYPGAHDGVVAVPFRVVKDKSPRPSGIRIQCQRNTHARPGRGVPPEVALRLAEEASKHAALTFEYDFVARAINNRTT